jgi:hypothetical protein
MNRGDDDDSPLYIATFPYSASIASSASSSSASVWSSSSSQSDDASSVTSSLDSDSSDCCYGGVPYTSNSSAVDEPCPAINASWPKPVEPAQPRLHPRRTSASSTRSGCPPPLVRQCDRKVNFVDSLVGKLKIRSPPISLPPLILPSQIPPPRS